MWERIKLNENKINKFLIWNDINEYISLDEMNNDKYGDKFLKCNKILKMKEWYEMDNVLMDIRNKWL